MKTDKTAGIIKVINRKWIFPAVHMMITTLYMAFGFKYQPLPFGEMTAANPINWSESSEHFAHILMSGILGCLLYTSDAADD